VSRYLSYAAGVLAFAACSRDYAADSPAPSAAALSGIDMQYVDQSVRPQDDPYRYLNGKWLDSFQLPADKATYGSFVLVDDETQEQLRHIVDGLQNSPPSEPEARKLADLYASFMNEAQLEKLGVKPLKPEFAAIEVMTGKAQIPALIAHLNQIGAGAPYDVAVVQDARNSAQYALTAYQSGLGLPDRDYYSSDDPKLKEARTKYLAHIGTMLSMTGDGEAPRHAREILDLETKLAQAQWTRVENRDPVKAYNKVMLADLPALTPQYDWNAYFKGVGVVGKIDSVIVRQPSYFTAFAKILDATPLPVWKEYFKWRVLSAAAPFLSKSFVEERFGFAGTVLRGIPEDEPRWKRGMGLLGDTLGEALGKRYTEKYFPPQSKARMEALVSNLINAYRKEIETLDWMSPETKKGAQAKLDKLAVKIGYPNTWRDYSAVRISRDDLWGNVERANEFEFRRNIDKLGKPIDRNEWEMTPQTVNAYYNPPMNEIVFPAAILQPPYFNFQADDAVNYGAIGGVIGHEISHGFDDKGSQYDADGNLRDWFTKEDHEKFAAKTHALVAQYNAYEPVPGFHVNGELTLGENIGDNSGLEITYKAYLLSLGGREPPVIDGFTGAQRLYLGWVQAWRGKVREAEAIRRVKIDPHSPPAVRGSAPLLNQDGFYAAFGIKPGDKMYLAPEQRAHIW
jgi:putative endopeptidase